MSVARAYTSVTFTQSAQTPLGTIDANVEMAMKETAITVPVITACNVTATAQRFLSEVWWHLQ